MQNKTDILNKFNDAIKHTNFYKLSQKEQNFITKFSIDFFLTVSEIKNLILIANDIKIWDEGSIVRFTNLPTGEIKDVKQTKKKLLNTLYKNYNDLKTKPNNYSSFSTKKEYHPKGVKTKTLEKESLGLGQCPVASEKTRCCNLFTLDAVESCGFDCSYCSIQSFYNQNQVIFDKNFAEKLKDIKLDPNKRYHIGTGQSSDSLMWGNKEGVLDAIFDFTAKHPNVILELKTKSDNIKYLLENDIPKNVIVTWSLNTPVIIENEEHLTAKLDKRIESARKVADKGIKVGFHFHPIVEYENYLEDYTKIYKRLQNDFSSDEVTLVSFGTLTFIKPVLKQIRSREFKTKIHQIPLTDAEGKLSYPFETKIEMFKTSYEAFKSWHGKVFFYLCMEPHSLWKECFGYEYKNNDEFEQDMLENYLKKVNR